jgi:Leucine-rich repeat (LRR) protein
MQNLSELHTLKLARNSIDEISVDAFIRTKKLSVLQLQDNDLAEVDFLTSNQEEQPGLMNLDLSNNQLENLKNFVSTPKLYKLKIDGSNRKNT